MKLDMIELDGSRGEGGGQILRTALSLSMVTGQAFHLTQIRAGRAKPGLLRQHLTAVQAAAEICGAHVEGASLGSQNLHFAPGTLRGGDYRFAIGTAGSCTLVLQTVLPALWYAEQPASISVSGGTHNHAAPPADFLIHAWLPLLRRMGIEMDIELIRHGFYPAGGGEVRARTVPGQPCVLTLTERGALSALRATAIVAGVSRDVAQRELAQLARLFPDVQGQERVLPAQHGPGNALLVEAACEGGTEILCSFGERGVSAEKVANRLAEQLRVYLESGCAVGGYMADQLVLPMALAGGGAFTASERSGHLTTNIEVIERFLPVAIACEPSGAGWRITVS